MEAGPLEPKKQQQRINVRIFSTCTQHHLCFVAERTNKPESPERFQTLQCRAAEYGFEGCSGHIFPRASERRVLLIVRVCYIHLQTFSHLLIYTSSHLHNLHIHIFSSYIFTSSHLPTLYLQIFSSSQFLILHLHIFSSSHLTSSHRLIFTSSHLLILHLHIVSSSHLLVFSSSHLLILHLLISTSFHLLIFTSSGGC